MGMAHYNFRKKGFSLKGWQEKKMKVRNSGLPSVLFLDSPCDVHGNSGTFSIIPGNML